MTIKNYFAKITGHKMTSDLKNKIDSAENETYFRTETFSKWGVLAYKVGEEYHVRKSENLSHSPTNMGAIRRVFHKTYNPSGWIKQSSEIIQHPASLPKAKEIKQYSEGNLFPNPTSKIYD